MKTPCLSGNPFHVDELCPIARLPTELLVGILLFVLPNIHAVANSQQSHEYMTHLYALRSVSKTWRGVIDGTPILWCLISSTLPVQVNATSVSRSLDTPLVVFYDSVPDHKHVRLDDYSYLEPQSAISSARTFAEWADVVRYRWYSATFKLALTAAPELLAKPAPHLQSLNILLYGRSLAGIPQIHLLGGCTEKLRHVKIGRAGIQAFHNHNIPMFWPNGVFQSLKGLHFGYVRSASFTTRYILEVLGASPELETLVLSHNTFQHDSTDSELPQVVLPRLQRLRYSPNHDGGIDRTLRHITLLPDSVKSIWITDHNFTSQHTSDRCEEFLTTVLSPLLPVFVRLHERCGGSSLSLYSPTNENTAHFYWSCRLKDLELRLFVPTVLPSTLLQWVGRVLRIANSGITLLLPANSLREDALRTMRSMQGVDEIILCECVPEDIPNVQRLLDTLGQVDSASPISTSMATFPSLHTLQITDWDTQLDSFIGMLRARFSRPSDQDNAGRVPDLSLNLSFRRLVRDQDHGADNIPNLELVEEMRALPGVKEVRLGKVSNSSGLLGVVWNEELMTPVWG